MPSDVPTCRCRIFNGTRPLTSGCQYGLNSFESMINCTNLVGTTLSPATHKALRANNTVTVINLMLVALTATYTHRWVYHPGAICRFVFFHGRLNLHSKQHTSRFGTDLHRANRALPIDFSSILVIFIDETLSIILILNKELWVNYGILE
jgi:hypothetical protein